MFRTILVFTVLFCGLKANAQMSDSLYKALPDSLRPRNKMVLTDQDRMHIIRNISPTLIPNHYNELKVMMSQVETAMGKVNTDEEKIPYAFATASFYANAGEYIQSFQWLQKVVYLGRREKAYRHLISEAYLNIAIEHARLAKQDSAVAMLQKAATIASADHDSMIIQSIYYAYIPIYRGLGLYHQAIQSLDTYVKAIPARDKWNDVYTDLMIGKANLYSRLYQNEGKEFYADSARRIVQDILVTKKNQASYWYYGCYSALGVLEYFHQNYKAAFAYFKASLLPQYRKPGSYQTATSSKYLMYQNACLVWMGQPEAVSKLLSITIPANDFYTRQELNRVLYIYYQKQGDYRKALDYHIQYEAYSDSIDVIGQRGTVFEAEQKYSLAQKEADIVQLENKNLQAQATRDRILVTGAVLLLITGLLAALFYIRTKRQEAQRLAERQKLTDELQMMEHEMELERLSQQADREAAITGERRTISQNMHDEVSSSLAALRYLIADIRQQARSLETIRALTEVEDEAKTVYLQSREFMHRLHNDRTSQTYNVVDLLENLSLRFGEGSGLQVVVAADVEAIQKNFTTQQHTELYRIIKEAVANSMKHAGAERIAIRIHVKDDQFYFDIEDNGRGLRTQDTTGLGLTTMQQRIAALKGHLQINSGIKGLHLTGSFPIG